MTRHQIVIEVDRPEPRPAYLLMLDLADEAEDQGFVVTDVFVREAPEDEATR